MKNTCCALVAFAILLLSSSSKAQTENTPKTNKKHRGTTVSITYPGGLIVQKKDSSVNKVGAIKDKDIDSDNHYDSEEDKEVKGGPRFKTGITTVDLGINILKDNTNYSAPAVKSFLNVPASQQNASLFDLRQGKSINVNIYPLLVRYKALQTHGQRIYITSGLGLQLYNFRFDQPITYTRDPQVVILYAQPFKKDKLAMDYMNVPLMFTFKTRLSKKNWLVYGGGITEGFRLDSWTKQVLSSGKKVKVHDAFGLADFNTCLTAEFGIENYFRLFASYQITSLYTNGLDQHPVCFGFRFTGI